MRPGHGSRNSGPAWPGQAHGQQREATPQQQRQQPADVADAAAIGGIEQPQAAVGRLAAVEQVQGQRQGRGQV
ncbi:MAG: hypothetical protein ACK4V5_07295, partial [Cyanobium sp.]